MGTRVFIGRLSNSARARDIERFFKGYGRIRDIVMKTGFGFVEFENPRDADDAVYDLNGRILCGERVTIEHAKSPNQRGGGRSSSYGSRSSHNDRYSAPTRTDYRVVVENVSSRVTWQELRDFINKVGEVMYLEIHKDGKEADVEFATLGDMKNAITKLSGTELKGRRIRLVQEERGHSRHRSKSPSRRRSGHSRSHSRTRSRSPRARSGSRVSRSSRKSRSPRRASRSPRRTSRSPRRTSRSPRVSRSPRRASVSPRVSRSPRRASVSPRKSPRRASRSRSPRPVRSPVASRSCSRERKSMSRSPSPRSPRRSHSHSPARSSTEDQVKNGKNENGDSD